MAKKKPSAQDTLRSEIKSLVSAGMLNTDLEIHDLSAGSLLVRAAEFDVEIRFVVKKERVELPDTEADAE